jgi:hypothetical protein
MSTCAGTIPMLAILMVAEQALGTEDYFAFGIQ